MGWSSEGYTAQFAANVRNERIRAARHGDMPECQKKVTFGDVWAKYDKWLESGHSYPEKDRQRYRDHLKLPLENMPLSSISPLLLEDIKKTLFEKNLAPATVKHCLVIVRQVINKAIAWGLWSGVNPVKQIKLPQVQNETERYLTQGEAQRLISALEHVPQTQGMAIVSLETGLRANEIMAMQWQDLDFGQGIINVRGKGGYDRKAYMTDIVKRVLQELPRDKTDYVFESRNGGRMTQISRAFYRAVKTIGLNLGPDGEEMKSRKHRINFHSLRHTYASWLAIAGVPLYTIKELMGHKSIEMTMRYAHLCPDHKREAAARISGQWCAALSDQEKPRYPEGDTGPDGQA